MWKNYFQPTTIEQALEILADKKETARIVAGATDLILELEAGMRPGVDTLIDITRIPCLKEIVLDEEGLIHLGPLVTHNDCASSKLILPLRVVILSLSQILGLQRSRFTTMQLTWHLQKISITFSLGEPTWNTGKRCKTRMNATSLSLRQRMT